MNARLLLTLLLALTFVLSACSPRQTPAAPTAPDSSGGAAGILPAMDEPTAEPPAPAEPTAPAEEPGAAPQNPEPRPMDGTIEWLRQALGATLASGVENPLFFEAENAQVLDVNGARVEVYEFATADAAREAAGTISGGGYIIGNMQLEWITAPHFWHSDRLIAFYVGTDPAVLGQLNAQLGQPIVSPQG